LAREALASAANTTSPSITETIHSPWSPPFDPKRAYETSPVSVGRKPDGFLVPSARRETQSCLRLEVRTPNLRADHSPFRRIRYRLATRNAPPHVRRASRPSVTVSRARRGTCRSYRARLRNRRVGVGRSLNVA